MPGRPGVSNRPAVPDRPLVGDRPGISTLPAPIDRPGIGDRPGISTLPAPIERPGLGDRPSLGNRPGLGGDRIPGGREDRLDAIRDRWARPVPNRPFDRNWWGVRQTNNVHWHWHAGWNRFPAAWWWRPATWVSFGRWFTWTWARPFTYEFGTTIVYRDNYIFVNDRQLATVEAFQEQAAAIAKNVPDDFAGEEAEWMPLGVFAIAEDSATDTGMMIQLAVSRQGVISGAFYNEITDTLRPLVGSVDQTSQRAAWRFADGVDEEIVMETGIFNLTQDNSTAMVHFGSGKFQTWLLVRLPEPSEEAAAPPE